ncbi:MAG: UDP-N-acetylmuramoyl-tripeptide--D-alanyl-D-alanine ligase, partial [Bacteroidota bacterium]
TTTKELIASVLGQEKRIFATQGNYNNHIGVPLTLLATPADLDLVIVEMGTNQPGDIQELVEIADPDLGLITNIGKAHLEKLGSIAGIREEKGALFDWVMGKEGPIYWYAEDPHLEIAVGDYPDAKAFGPAGSALEGSLLTNRPEGMHVRLKYQDWDEALEVRSALSGAYNFPNILAAALVGAEQGISPAGIKAGLEAYRPSNNRSQVLERGGYTIWLDAYNANPTSMAASVQNAFSLGKEKVALILGDMLELGPEATELHAEIGHLINQHDPFVTVALGPHMQAMYAVVGGKKASFRDVEHASSHVADLVSGADLILIKGSRGMALERLVDLIAPEPASAG